MSRGGGREGGGWGVERQACRQGGREGGNKGERGRGRDTDRHAGRQE